MFYIYKIINKINNKIYIGKTSNIKKRLKKHIESMKYSNSTSILHKAFKKYGIDNFIIEEIDRCNTQEEASQKEIYWIAYFKSNICKYPDDNGYNLTDGGEGTNGLKWTENSKNKIRGNKHYNFGKPLSNETKQKLSIIMKGDKNPFYGKKHSNKTINLLKNKIISEDTKNKLKLLNQGEKHPQSKLTDNMVKIIKYMYDETKYSQTDVAKMLNIKPNTINQIIKNKRWKHIK